MTRVWTNRVASVALGAMIGIACASEPEAGQLATVLEDLPVPGEPGWASLEPGEKIVATVGQVPITATSLELALEANPELAPRDVLNRLVELESLAQEAHREGLVGDAQTRGSWRRALVHRYLQTSFEDVITKDTISRADVERVYKMPQIRKLYDHADSWRMAHLFVTCCDPKIEDCDTEEVLTCFQEAASLIHGVWDEVKPRASAIEGEPEGLVALMKAYRTEVEERFPQLAYRDRAFYYDPDKPHEEQKGYNVLAEVVARTVMDAPLANLQEPVQSPFGWHILAKLDHIPESRRGPDDPEVAEDIRQNLFPKYLEARFRDLLGRLAQKYGASMAQVQAGP